jgi:hypothetical protein
MENIVSLLTHTPDEAILPLVSYIQSRGLVIQTPDYGINEILKEYLEENLSKSSKLLISMFSEMNQCHLYSPRYNQLIAEIDSTVLGWIEMWISLKM